MIDVEKLREKLEKAEKVGNLPKIIIPVHLAGTSCDMPEINKLSEKYEEVEEEINQLQNFDKEKNKNIKNTKMILVFSYKRRKKFPH